MISSFEKRKKEKKIEDILADTKGLKKESIISYPRNQGSIKIKILYSTSNRKGQNEARNYSWQESLLSRCPSGKTGNTIPTKGPHLLGNSYTSLKTRFESRKRFERTRFQIIFQEGRKEGNRAAFHILPFLQRKKRNIDDRERERWYRITGASRPNSARDRRKELVACPTIILITFDHRQHTLQVGNRFIKRCLQPVLFGRCRSPRTFQSKREKLAAIAVTDRMECMKN